jgi:hypothetical protein
MKSFRARNVPALTVLLGALVLGTAAPPALAQGDKAPAAIQKEYDQFIAKFRVALKANDAAAVTGLTRFPFHWNENRDAEYFRKNLYAKIFTPRIRTCIGRGKGYYAHSPSGETSFTVVCGEDLYLFTKTPEGFRFAETGVND